MKHRLQGIAIGLLVSVFMLGTVSVIAVTETKRIEVVFNNYKTSLFGKEYKVKNITGDTLESFAYNGSVYVPMEAILHALGENAQWNVDTDTLNFGVLVEDIAIFSETVPPYDVSHRSAQDIVFSNDVRIRDQVVLSRCVKG
jgi:hypothetical protein